MKNIDKELLVPRSTTCGVVLWSAGAGHVVLDTSDTWYRNVPPVGCISGIGKVKRPVTAGG